MSTDKETIIFMVVIAVITLVFHASMIKWNDSPKSKSVILHDGTQGFAIDCSGSKFIDCEEIHGKICPNGYTISSADTFRTQFIIKCAIPK